MSRGAPTVKERLRAEDSGRSAWNQCRRPLGNRVEVTRPPSTPSPGAVRSPLPWHIAVEPLPRVTETGVGPPWKRPWLRSHPHPRPAPQRTVGSRTHEAPGTRSEVQRRREREVQTSPDLRRDVGRLKRPSPSTTLRTPFDGRPRAGPQGLWGSRSEPRSVRGSFGELKGI